MSSHITQRDTEIIILFFFHSCDNNVIMLGSYSTYSDLLDRNMFWTQHFSYFLKKLKYS